MAKIYKHNYIQQLEYISSVYMFYIYIYNMYTYMSPRTPLVYEILEPVKKSHWVLIQSCEIKGQNLESERVNHSAVSRSLSSHGL